jgi:predicted PurR-regulated permease PerM
MDVAETPHAGAHEDEPQRLHRAQTEMAQPGKPGGRALGTLAILAVLYTLYTASAILLPFVLAIVLYLLLSPVMRFLTRRAHLPRVLAALLLIILLFIVVGGVAAAISVPASEWMTLKSPSTTSSMAISRSPA